MFAPYINPIQSQDSKSKRMVDNIIDQDRIKSKEDPKNFKLGSYIPAFLASKGNKEKENKENIKPLNPNNTLVFTNNSFQSLQNNSFQQQTKDFDKLLNNINDSRISNNGSKKNNYFSKQQPNHNSFNLKKRRLSSPQISKAPTKYLGFQPFNKADRLEQIREREDSKGQIYKMKTKLNFISTQPVFEPKGYYEYKRRSVSLQPQPLQQITSWLRSWF